MLYLMPTDREMVTASQCVIDHAAYCCIAATEAAVTGTPAGAQLAAGDVHVVEEEMLAFYRVHGEAALTAAGGRAQGAAAELCEADSPAAGGSS
jgi:hypothetical protein